MSRASGPRRAAASAGLAVAIAAGAAGGLVAADLERASATAAPSSIAADVLADPQPLTVAEPDTLPSLTAAPAPQNPRAGQVPHTTTRAS